MGWTVQSLIDGNMAIEVYCHNPKCRHHSGLDLEAVKTKLGPDAPAMADDLEPKLRCSKCRGKKVGLIYSPKTPDATAAIEFKLAAG